MVHVKTQPLTNLDPLLVAGASRNPCSNTYMGTKAFSEPESKAVRDFLLQHSSTMKGFFSFHSFGQLWMYPYGYKRRTYTEDMAELVGPLWSLARLGKKVLFL